MDVLDNPADLWALASTFFLLLLCSNRALLELTAHENEEEDDEDPLLDLLEFRHLLGLASSNIDQVMDVVLHNVQLWNFAPFLGDELGFWVKPRSTTWFSRFFLQQYDDDRWVQLFRMTKASVFSLADILHPTFVKKDTKYRLATPVLVRVACTLFKLTHGASLLVCNELFAVGQSSVSMILCEVVNAVNVVLRGQISWPQGTKLLQTESEFRDLYGLPGVVGAIDGTHVGISKPQFGCSDYYYFKSGGYSMNCQAVVDCQNCFLDLFLGMPRSTNDAQVLRRSSLFHKANQNTLWDASLTFNGFTPYVLGDAGYPITLWLMVPHRDMPNMSIADSLYNRRHRRGRCVVENTFAMLKQTFRELLVKCDLHVTFVPDVIIACAILHNMLQRQSAADVQRLRNVLQMEGLTEGGVVTTATSNDLADENDEESPFEQAMEKHWELGMFLAISRAIARP